MILEDERIDDLQCKGYRLIQKPKGFCFGVDAVLLSDFARVKKKQRVLDLCTGSGAVFQFHDDLNLLSQYTYAVHFTLKTIHCPYKVP